MELSYLAGFFDGEGSVSFGTNKNRRPYLSLRVNISQRDPSVLLAIRDIFGGSLYISRASRGNRECFHLEIGGKAAERFLRAMQPHVIVKATHIQAALDIYTKWIEGRLSYSAARERWAAFRSDYIESARKRAAAAAATSQIELELYGIILLTNHGTMPRFVGVEAWVWK